MNQISKAFDSINDEDYWLLRYNQDYFCVVKIMRKMGLNYEKNGTELWEKGDFENLKSTFHVFSTKSVPT